MVAVAGPKDIALMGFSVARSLHGRWRRLSEPARDRLEPLADDVRERALDLRGSADPDSDGQELGQASRRLADAMIDDAAGDPEVSEIEVRDLRSELARELSRLADESR
jgi:hypothetical protein